MIPAHLESLLQELNLKLPAVGTVLLVDDDAENLAVLEALLRRQWVVLRAPDGVQALELLRTRGPVDLVMTDQRMPGMSGVELLTQVAERWPDTVRVVLTAFSDVQPLLDAINSGTVFRFLVKPYDLAAMQQVVVEAMEHRAAAAAQEVVMVALRRQKGVLQDTLEELQQTQRLLLTAQKASTLGGLLSGIVHDLRGMASILSLLMAKVGRADPHPEVLATAGAANSHLVELLALLQHVLAFARLRPGEARRELADCGTFFRQTVGLFGMEPLGRRCPVELQLDPQAHWLQVDTGHLTQGIIALLRNAAQASPTGAPIELSLRLHYGGNACVEVADHGTGMDACTVHRAPEPFFSAFQPPGLGLGLEVARLAAELHGGSVELQSTLNQGTRARIYLSAVSPEHRGPS